MAHIAVQAKRERIHPIAVSCQSRDESERDFVELSAPLTCFRPQSSV